MDKTGPRSDAPRLIPFQAYLTDAEGRPLEGVCNLTFRVYAQLGDENYEWEDPHTAVPVHKGMVNVILGSVAGNPVPDYLAFDTAKYVGVRVDGEDEMQPRQQIIPALHAIDAERLGGSPAGFRCNSIEIVPIGTVTSWFGNPATLPSNWTLCDGRTINDVESPLNGITVPDMRAGFARGESDNNRDIPAQGANSGGSDTDSWYVPDHSHGISVSSAGQHQHTISAAGEHKHETTVFGQGDGSLMVDDSHPFGTGGYVSTNTFGFSVSGVGSGYWHLTNSAGNHAHTCVASGAHSHSAACANAGAAGGTVNTVPRYVALHYIIRIK